MEEKLAKIQNKKNKNGVANKVEIVPTASSEPPQLIHKG